MQGKKQLKATREVSPEDIVQCAVCDVVGPDINAILVLHNNDHVTRVVYQY